LDSQKQQAHRFKKVRSKIDDQSSHPTERQGVPLGSWSHLSRFWWFFFFFFFFFFVVVFVVVVIAS
jgi:hypothetical protein